MTSVRSAAPAETVALGEKFARELAPGAVVALTGTLGSGKTQMVIGLCRGLGVTARVASPTFTLINEYAAPFGSVVHIDLYRIDTRRELVELGIQEYFNDRCICLIEWAERMEEMLPADALVVRIEHGTRPEERIVSFGRQDGGRG
jgi:tRNA threonylcarbamoyladenosine biosynthesis protein TsaE